MAHLDALIRKLETIHQNLGGGGSGRAVQAKKGDKFGAARIRIDEMINEIETTQDKKSRLLSMKSPEDPEVLRLKYEIVLLIKETDKELVNLHSIIQKEIMKKVKYRQKVNEIDLEAKQAKYELLVRKLEDIKNSEDIGEGISLNAPGELGRMKAELLNLENLKPEGLGREGEKLDIEEEAVERWKGYDKQIDELAELIGEGVDELKERALNLNEEFKKQEAGLDKLMDNVENTGEELETTTKRMKKVLAKVRAGDKFCVTLCLVILLIGLLTVAYNMIG